MPAVRSDSGVSAVVAVILLVAITAVLTGVLYLIVMDLARSTEDVPPRILLVNVGNPAGEAQFRLSVTQIRPLEEFQLRLWVNGSLDAPSEMNPVFVGTAGKVAFGDFDGGGTMTEGDTITVATSPQTTYELALLWKGHALHKVDWTT